MPFPFVALAVSAAFTFVGQLLAPRTGGNKTAFDDIQVPTATEDRPKPMWVGTVRHRSPNCIWYGDYSVKTLKSNSVIGAIFSFGASLLNKPIIGYKYMLGFQLDLGWGQMDEITRIAMNDKVAWTGSVSSGTITINNDKLFGGVGSGANGTGNGGFQGRIVVYNGNGTQVADPYVVAKSGATPAYKNDVILVFKGLTDSTGAYIGGTAAVPELELDVRRCPNTLGVTLGKHVIDTYDANPICALYEFMTRKQSEFGGGFSAAQFNTANWITAAETLHTEGLGISRMFDSSQDVETVISEFLQLVDGVINVNMTTGKFEIVLARLDYNPNTILSLGEDDVIEVVSYKRGSWVETLNEVKLSYIDRTQEFQSIPVAAQDGANSSGQGEVRSTTVQILGLTNPTTANKVVFRELRVVSTPLATLTIRCNRKAFQLYGGAVFKWVGTRYGVAGSIFRVAEVDSGTLQNGVIEVRAVQDIFSLGSASYLPPTPTTWTPPTTTSSPVITQRIIEQPYLFHSSVNHRVFTVAKPADGAQQSYDLHTKESTSGVYVQRLYEASFTPSGTLVNAYTSTAYNTLSQLIVTPDALMDELPTPVAASDITAGIGGGLIVLNNEILAYESYTINGSGQYVFNGVWGGLLDTLLAAHAIGDRIWFISLGMAIDPTNHTAAATINAKLASIGSNGAVPLASCSEITI